jgi:hypothetical protein
MALVEIAATKNIAYKTFLHAMYVLFVFSPPGPD